MKTKKKTVKYMIELPMTIEVFIERDEKLTKEQIMNSIKRSDMSGMCCPDLLSVHQLCGSMKTQQELFNNLEYWTNEEVSIKQLKDGYVEKEVA